MSLYPIYDFSALKPQGREESILYFILKKDVIWCVKIKPLVILLFMYFWFLYYLISVCVIIHVHIAQPGGRRSWDRGHSRDDCEPKRTLNHNSLLRFVTRQLFRQFRTDQFISKLSIIGLIWITQCKQNNIQWEKPHSYSYRNKIYQWRWFVVEGFWAENVQNVQF